MTSFKSCVSAAGALVGFQATLGVRQADGTVTDPIALSEHGDMTGLCTTTDINDLFSFNLNTGYTVTIDQGSGKSTFGTSTCETCSDITLFNSTDASRLLGFSTLPLDSKL